MSGGFDVIDSMLRSFDEFMLWGYFSRREEIVRRARNISDIRICRINREVAEKKKAEAERFANSRKSFQDLYRNVKAEADARKRKDQQRQARRALDQGLEQGQAFHELLNPQGIAMKSAGEIKAGDVVGIGSDGLVRKWKP